jgi:hypothetical protein
MNKKAYLVTFSVCTRTVAKSKEDAVKKAIDWILGLPFEYIMEENVDTVEIDKECPYGTLSSDKEE